MFVNLSNCINITITISFLYLDLEQPPLPLRLRRTLRVHATRVVATVTRHLPRGIYEGALWPHVAGDIYYIHAAYVTHRIPITSICLN
jgi:hypothetical protein